MLGIVPPLTLVGVGPVPASASSGTITGEGSGVLRLLRGGWHQPDDAPEPVRPPASPARTFLGWFAIAVLVAALLMPFSLVALMDLVRYLSR